MIDDVERQRRFWNKVNKDGPVDPALGTPCWLWTGALVKGYGEFRNGPSWAAAHRFSWQLINGDCPPRLDHRCRTRACVNPEHLRPVSNKENAENLSGPHRDSTSGIRGVSRMSGCDRWHAKVTHNGKQIYVGLFKTKEEAEAAVIQKRLEVFTHNDADRS